MAIANSPILGQYEANKAETSNKTMTDKDTFMKLLLAQMTNQDPLSPMEDTEFIAQLAQFTSVEELQNLNASVAVMSESIRQSQVSNAVGLIGSAVEAKGDFVRFIPGGGPDGSDYCTTLSAEFPRNANEVYVNIYAADKDGNPGPLVYSDALGNQAAGTFDFTWSGKNNNGSTMPGGSYIINISAVDSAGSNMLVESKSAGIVIGVSTEEDGNHKLYLDDGRTVLYNNVKTITYVADQQPETPKDPDETETPEDPDDTETPDEENSSGDSLRAQTESFFNNVNTNRFFQ